MAFSVLFFSALTHPARSQDYENQYGRLSVYPDVSTNIIRQRQYYNLTWFYPSNVIDLAFCFTDPLSYGRVYHWNGSGYVPVNFQHIEYAGKHWYVRQNINVVQYQSIVGYWEYDIPINSSGKWDLYAKLSSDTIAQALQSGRFIHLDPWWNSSYHHYKQITINASYIDADLVGFPILIYSANTSMISEMDGGDSIRFVNTANTTEYPYEIERFASNEMIVWVNVSRIDDTTDTKINMYYNNTNAVDGQNASRVWDSYFKFVYHMDDDGTSVVDDSTSYDNDGNKASANNPAQATGKIGYGQLYDTNTDGITTESTIALGTTEYTVECYYKSSSASNQVLFNNRGGGTNYLSVDLQTVSPKWRIRTFLENTATKGYTYTNTLPNSVDGVWRYAVSTRDNTGTGLLRIYNNGTNDTYESVDLDATYTITTNTMSLGKDPLGTGSTLVGYLDECRMSLVRRNDSWIKAQYHSMNRTTGFITMGIEHVLNEIQYVPTPANNSEVYALNLTELSIDINFTLGLHDTDSYVNISVNGTYQNYSNVENGTYVLDVSGIIFDEGSSYRWYVNTSDGLLVKNNSWFNFSCLVGCQCGDELEFLYWKIEQVIDTMNNDDYPFISGFNLGDGLLGLMLVFGIFSLAILMGREENEIWRPILLFFDTPISLATGIFYVGSSVFSIEWWIGVLLILFAILLSLGGLYYALEFGRK